MDPHTGEVLALVGSADYFNASIHGALNMAITPRQSGSAFKPFIYALALDPDQEAPWTAATPILDVTTTFLDDAGAAYTPRNYDGREHGPVPLRTALGSSLNIPAVITLEHVGYERVLDLAARLHIASLGRREQYHLSLALGGGEMSLLELVSAYAAFANDGRYPERVLILDVRDPDGNLLLETDPPPAAPVFDPRLAWLISDILSDDAARALTFGSNSILRLDRTAAVKTGTTSNFHDNWTIGYTPDLVVGVWVGNAGFEPMRNVTGLTGAAPIWTETMRALLQGQPDRPFVRPAGLTQVDVCDLSGLLPTRDCRRTYSEWFLSGTEPMERDAVYHIVFLDSATGRLVTAATPTERIFPLTVYDLPMAAIPWAQSAGLPLYSDYIQVEATPQAEPILLLWPRPDTTYRLVDTFDRDAQQAPVEAVVGQPVREVRLWVDDVLLAAFTAPPYRAWWPLAPGEHRVRAEAFLADGSRIASEAVTITVVYESP